jgi:hypothetical protein
LKLLAKVANGSVTHIVVDRHNFNNFKKVAEMAKANFYCCPSSFRIGLKSKGAK